jgi:micrococcal nuclease
MKKIIFLLLFIISFSGCSNKIIENKPLYTTSIINNEFYKVLSVIDGDTITIKQGNYKKTIRILGIDTPEKKGGYRKEECFGDEASEYTKHLLKNKKIRLVKSKVGNQEDKYKRLLRYVYIDDKDIGEELIKNGYAESYKKFPHDKKNLYNEIEKESQKNEKGMWNKSSCK